MSKAWLNSANLAVASADDGEEDDGEVIETTILRPPPDETKLESVEQVPEKADQPRVRSAAPPRDLPTQRVHRKTHVRANAPDQVCQSSHGVPRALVEEPRKDSVKTQRVLKDTCAEVTILPSPVNGVCPEIGTKRFGRQVLPLDLFFSVF